MQALYTMSTQDKSTRGCLWAGATNTSSAQTGVTISGEFSGALTDCGQWLNGRFTLSCPFTVSKMSTLIRRFLRHLSPSTGVGPNGTSTSTLPEEVCSLWRDWRTWTDDQKSQVKTLVLDEMDALGNFMFWTWKIGVSDVLGYASAAEWHYQVRGRVFRSFRRSLPDNSFGWMLIFIFPLHLLFPLRAARTERRMDPDRP